MPLLSESKIISSDKGFWNIEEETFVESITDASVIESSSILWSEIAKIKSKRIVHRININVVRELIEIEVIKKINLLD
jgi:hypothetical protein